MKQKILDNIKVSESGCWEWQRSLTHNGYGRIYHSGTKELTHRYAYKVFNGPITDGLMVMHSCDNRKCCNPDHLSVGTASDNMRDMVSKGRHVVPDNRGSNHGMSKLTEETVREIFVDSRPQYLIAAEYGISKSAVSSIKRRTRWQHVTSTLDDTK